MKKKIIILDDDPVMAVLMKAVIEEDQDLELSQITTTRDEFLEFAGREHFDAAFIDISVEGREGGVELLSLIKHRGIHLPLIMLSSHDEMSYALKCLRAGASGYLNKRYICSQIVTCIKEVLEGRMFVSGDKGEYILKQYRSLKFPVSSAQSRV